MIALRVNTSGLHIADVPAPSDSGEVLVKVSLSGICNTDLEIVKGYAGFQGTIGHEFVGVAQNGELAGRRVVGEINAGCGTCLECSTGDRRHCARRSVLGIGGRDGAHAEYVSLPHRNLIEVPDNVPDEMAVFVEPLAAACEILDQVALPESAEIAVLGDGKLGLLVGQALRAAGHRVHQFGRHKEKLRIAEKAGVTTEIARARLPVAVYDWVVEATGSSDGLRQAVQMTRPRGTVFMKSTVHGKVPLDTAPVIVHEISLVGSRCGRFEPALRLLANGRIQVEEMISEILSLSDAPRAFRLAQQSGVLKVLLADSGK